MLLSSGMTLDRGVVHQSVISRLQILPSCQTSDASYSIDKVSRNQRRGPFSVTITLRGVTLKGSYFANPQQLSGMGGVNMMSVDCHLPSFTLLLPGQQSVLKPSIQSSRGKLLTLKEAVEKSGFAKLIFNITRGSSEEASFTRTIESLNEGEDSDVVVSEKLTKVANAQQQFIAGAQGEANFNPFPLEDGDNPFEASGAPMQAPAPSQPLAMGAGTQLWAGGRFGEGDREGAFDMDVNPGTDFVNALVKAIQDGIVPVVFAFCNWGCTYTAQPACLSSGKSCYDLHSSGDG